MLLQLSGSFKLLQNYALFLSVSCRFRDPRTTFPIALSQSWPFYSSLPPLPYSLHTRAKPTCSLDLKLNLLEQENFSPSQVKLLENHPYFLAASVERIASLLSFLRAKGFPVALKNGLLTRAPYILQLSVEGLETKYKFFQELGIETLTLQKIFKSFNAKAVLGTAIKTFQKHIDFLQKMGLNKQDLLKIVSSYPKILSSNAVKMNETLVFLEHRGLSRDSILRLVRSNPRVFGYSIDRLSETLEFIRWVGLNIDERNGVRAFKRLIVCNRERLLSGMVMLKSHGFSEDDVYRMVQLQAVLLLKPEDSVKRRIDYLKNVLNRDVQEVAKYPTYLCLSFEKRIVPRFTFLNELNDRGKDTTKLSLCSVLVPSDERFEKRYSEYASWKARFLKQAGDR